MKLTFRTISGSSFSLDAELTTSVGDLKAAVEASQGPPMLKDSMKLVYKGKVLEDNSKAISEYNVDESGFLVVFVQKKPEAKPAAAAAGGASSSQPAAVEVRPCNRSPLSCFSSTFRCALQ
jgi:UV excision repair protein RAD23